MIKHISDCATLHNGVKMPWFGLGLYKSKDEELLNAFSVAIQTGYRSFDTAAMYDNEETVGEAIKRSEVPREQLFITSKVWYTEHGYEETLQAFEQSRKKLGLEYLDLYLIHWPLKDKHRQTWKALEKLYKEGYIRAIGVSNFHIPHLEHLLPDVEIVPMVNQVEFHPHNTQAELQAYCKERNIQLEAWSPLMRGGESLQHPVLVELAQKYGKTPAQIVLRWDLDKEVITIPKSVTASRIKENADIFDFTLTAEEINRIDSLNKNMRVTTYPPTFNM